MVIDFGKEICFNELMYMPRNDDNFVRIGDVYELFYHGEKMDGFRWDRKRLPILFWCMTTCLGAHFLSS